MHQKLPDRHTASRFGSRLRLRHAVRQPPQAIAKADAGTAPLKGPLAALLNAGPGTHALALLDQAVVSGTSFLTTILVGRWCLPSELGAYSLGVSLLVSWVVIQDSLLLLPYAIYRHRRADAGAAGYAGSVLAHYVLLSALAALGMAVLASSLSGFGAPPELSAVTWALAAIVPFTLLREFARQFSFAHLHMRRVVMLDAAVAAVQLVTLSWLAWLGLLSAVNACLAVGLACAAAGAVWLYSARGCFAFDPEQLWETVKQNWQLGKWIFASQLTWSAKTYFTYLVLVFLLGTAAAGVYAACMTIALFSNPLVLGLSNILTPRAALAVAEGGSAELRRVAVRDAVLLAAGMGAFCIFVFFAADLALRFLFPAEPYQGNGQIVTVLALALLVSALRMPAASAVTSLERPQLIFWANAPAAVATVVLVYVLTLEWGMLGAAYGYLSGSAAASVAVWVAFLALVRRPAPQPAARRAEQRGFPVAVQVLDQFTRSARPEGLIIERLGSGRQADVYVLKLQDETPIWRGCHSLLVKNYRPGTDPDLLRRQFQSLSRLHAILHGATVEGWKIFVPAPLYMCESPLALVMTMVPGRTLTSCLETGEDLHPAVLKSLSCAVFAAMERCWSAGHFHGDLQLHNILCDVPARQLAFLDAGAPLPSPALDPDLCTPATHDLAYLLYELAVTVKTPLSRTGNSVHKRKFTLTVLQAFMEKADPAQRFWELERLRARARQYVDRHVPPSRSPRGFWRALVRQMAFRRIDEIIGALRANPAETLSDVTPRGAPGALTRGLFQLLERPKEGRTQ